MNLVSFCGTKTNTRMRCLIRIFTVNLRNVLFKKAWKNEHYHPIFLEMEICLFVCIVALRPKSTAMVIAGRSVHLTTLFPGQA